MDSSYKISRRNKIIIISLIIVQIIMFALIIIYPPPTGNVKAEPTNEPAQSTNVRTVDVNDFNKFEKDDRSDVSVSYHMLLNNILVIFRLLSAIVVYPFTIYYLVMMIKSKIEYKKAKEKSEEKNSLEPESLNVKSKVMYKTFKAYLITAIVCYLVSGIMRVLSNFA